MCNEVQLDSYSLGVVEGSRFFAAEVKVPAYRELADTSMLQCAIVCAEADAIQEELLLILCCLACYCASALARWTGDFAHVE